MAETTEKNEATIETNADALKPVPRSGRLSVSSVATTGAAVAARNALNNAGRIAIITKFRFMGDTLVATPFLSQLRNVYPNAAITLLAAPAVATALEGCPDVDEIVPIEIRGRSRWQHSRELLRTLTGGNYQGAFLLNRSLHCAVITALARIPVRVGYVNEFRAPFLTVPIPYFFDRNEVDCHLDMLRALGFNAEDALPELWISEAERKEARELLAKEGWRTERPIIGIQPGANDPQIREWGAERYASIADRLADDLGGIVAIMGGKSESATAERMCASMRSRSINLVGQLGLREALAVIGQCNLWVGNDTGLLHAAVAQRVASVGIFGPNKVVRWGYNAPRHRSLVVFPDVPARDDEAVRRCLDAVTEEEVFQTAMQVYAEPHCPEANCERPENGRAKDAAQPPYFAATLAPSQVAPARRR